MRSSLTYDILEHLAEGGRIMLEAFFPPGYSYTDPSRRMFGWDRRCRHRFTPAQKISISGILSRLRREGLVARDGARKTSSWHITGRGRGHLRVLSVTANPLPKSEHNIPKKDGKLRIVVFDIPESERRKRDWLRTQLLACDFEPLQKSVWTGTRPLPEELIEEIDALDLGACVHIMSIGQKGTLILRNLG
ncbi:MAG: hypothetical protein WAP52_01335 [Candidatus Sungiibacteriota bacterium]